MNFQSRLLHFFADTIVYFLFSVGFIYLGQKFFSFEEIKTFLLTFYFVNYFLFEFFFGQTPGKMLTGYKVVKTNQDKSPEFKDILLRTLVRVIPFYFLTYLFSGKGLHDHLSNTYLIHKNSIK